jgi:hypothetical protein
MAGYDSIMSLNGQTLRHKMGGLLPTRKRAADARLLEVQNHLRTLKSDARVLTKSSDWTKPHVTNLLTAEPEGGFTSYFARDFAHQQEMRRRGFVVPYPQ